MQRAAGTAFLVFNIEQTGRSKNTVCQHQLSVLLCICNFKIVKLNFFSTKTHILKPNCFFGVMTMIIIYNWKILLRSKTKKTKSRFN